MASGGKKKTTMAKLTRESRLRERRLDKQARREARKLGLTPGPDQSEGISEVQDRDSAQLESPPPESATPESPAPESAAPEAAPESAAPEAGRPALKSLAQPDSDA